MTALALAPERQKLIPQTLSHSKQRIDIPGIGTLAYRESSQKQGRALVFLHGLTLGSGSYEFGPLQSAFADRRTLALDFPGFGSSSVAREASPASYAQALAAFIQNVAAEGEAVDVIATGRGCEVAALVAARRPRPIRSLVMLSPTGFGPARRYPKLAQLARELRRVPRLCEALYRARVSALGTTAALTALVDGRMAFALAQQADHPLGKRAYETPLSFLEASLSAEVGGVELYRALRVPTFVLFDRSPARSFDFLPEVSRDNAFVRSLRLGSRHGAPHLESTAVVENAAREFYQAIEVASRFEDWESTVETIPSFVLRPHRAA